MNQTVRKVWNAITWILVLCVACLAFLLAGVRLIGFTPYTVLSGSMEPVYPVGSLIYVRKVPPEEVRVGDPITFVLDENLTVATHRVIEVDSETRQFRTKGDANSAPDGAPVLFENLIGVPKFSIPKLGFAANWITKPPGMYISGAAVVVLLVLLFLPDLLDKADAADRNAAEKKARREAEENPR